MYGKYIFKARTIFINYRSFGHSISDTNAFLSSFREMPLCISIGAKFERNKFFNKFYNRGNLIIITLLFVRFFGRINVRKYVGPRLSVYLNWLKNHKILSSKTVILTENKNVVLECIVKRVTKFSLLDTGKLPDFIKYVSDLDQVSRESSKAISLWAQIYNPNYLNDKMYMKDLASYRTSLLNLGINSKQVVTWIVRIGDSPHHGPGLEKYSGILNWLNMSNRIVIALGDTTFDEKVFMTYPNLYNWKRLGLNAKSLPFLAINDSLFTFGDGSGVWTIVTLLGKFGLLFNTIPSKALYHNIEVLPRPWVDKYGNYCTLDQLFDQLGEKVRNEERGAIIDGFHPVHHSEDVMLKVFQRYENERVKRKPLEMDAQFIKYFNKFGIRLLKNCSISPELIEELRK